MTKTEINIQVALGILPFYEWMKLKGISLKNGWWYFPISNNRKCKFSKTVTMNGIKYYLVADVYIEVLQHSMAWRKWTEKKFATEVIKQCYACMDMETIDH